VEDILATLEVPLELDMKGFGDEEPLPKPNTNEEGIDDGKAKGVDQIFQELGLHRGSDSKNDSKEEKEMLIAQIESATLALHARKEQLGHSKEHEVNPTSKDGSKQKLKAINDIIEENEKVFHAFKRNRDHYLKKHEWEEVCDMDNYLLWESKLKTLQRKHLWVENERRGLNLQIKEKQKEYYDAIAQEVPTLDVLASSSNYGSILEELAQL